MLIVMSFICVLSLIIGLVILFAKSLSSMIRIPVIILCVIVFVTSAFLNIVMLDGWRIEKGAEKFLHATIQNSRNDILPPTSEPINLDQKEKYYEILRTLPKCDYEVSYHDYFFGIWEYEVHFDNGQSYFISIDDSGLFMKLFLKAEYSLFCIEEIDQGPEAQKSISRRCKPPVRDEKYTKAPEGESRGAIECRIQIWITILFFQPKIIELFWVERHKIEYDEKYL